MQIAVLMGTFVLLLLLSVPIGSAIGLAVVTTIIAFPNMTTFGFLGSAMITSLNSFPLLAVPFFMLCGSIMGAGGLSQRLVRLGEALVGKFTGGLAMVTVVCCLFFGAISGSAPATVAAIGGIMIPAMVSKNYDKEFATGLSAVSGGLGVIIPPSIPFVFYGLSTGVSIGTLFMAGVIPGFIAGFLLCFVSTVICKRRGFTGTGHKFDAKELGAALWDGKWALLVPVIILGGIYGGIFTPTEAAVVACVYGIIVGKFIYKELAWKDMVPLIIDNGKLFGSVAITIATATVMGKLFSIMGLPATIASAIGQMTDNKIVVLLVINFFLLIVGMCMDVGAAILILAPVLYQVILPFGIDPVQFGVVMVINLAIGMCTPPVAINLFVASGMTGVPMMKVAKQAVPFIIAMLICLMLVTFIPGLSTWLPSILAG